MNLGTSIHLNKGDRIHVGKSGDGASHWVSVRSEEGDADFAIFTRNAALSGALAGILEEIAKLGRAD